MRESHGLISRSDRAERELTRLKHQLADELAYKAIHDPLTDVYNRGAIIDIISTVLTQRQASLIVLDIDHFKRVNDNFGHPTGDAVICELITRVRHALGGVGSIGRVGGEKFTILLDNVALQQAVLYAQRIQDDLNRSNLAALPAYQVTASFGVSWAPATTGFDTLYNAADAALYEAKQQGRNRVMFR